MRNIMCILPALSPFLTSWFPASVLCFWVTNNVCTLIQGVALTQPYVKKMLNIKTFSEAEYIKLKTLLFAPQTPAYVETSLPSRSTYFDNLRQQTEEEEEEEIFKRNTRRKKRKYMSYRYRLV